jgi:hypothetical protein
MPRRSCCPTNASLSTSLNATAVACLRALEETKNRSDLATRCVHEKTSAVESHAELCFEQESAFGVLVVSRAASRRVVCTAGDVYRVVLTGETVHVGATQLASRVSGRRMLWMNELGTSIDGAANVYWVDLRALALVPRPYTIDISVELVSTQRRQLQEAEGRGALVWNSTHGSPLRHWWRDHACVSKQVLTHKHRFRNLSGWGGLEQSLEQDPQCVASPAAKDSVYLDAGDRDGECGWLCSGNTTLILSPHGGRYAYSTWNPKVGPVDRSRMAFHHVLRPLHCRFHLYGEDELTHCLRGRKLLNIGSSQANMLQMGFERINRTVAGAKRTWWLNFGKTAVPNHYDLSVGTSVFGNATIVTKFIHHPERNGLTNIIAPPSNHLGHKRFELYERMMCSYDIVVLESGLHDFAIPSAPNRSAALLLSQRLAEVCSRTKPCTDDDLLPLLNFERWRLEPLQSYRLHLRVVVDSWARCRAKKPGFRPIFKLALAPNPTKCTRDWAYNSDAWHMLVANHAARQVVEAFGFEVFDPFAAGLHAPASWYNDHGNSNHADVLSDAITQQLLNQLCANDRKEPRYRLRLDLGERAGGQSTQQDQKPAAGAGAYKEASACQRVNTFSRSCHRT